MKGSTAAARVTSAVHWEVWGQHVAIAAAYVGFYEICRHLSVTQWMLMSGLRLACMVLLPTRYWPALVLGEELPLLENALLWGHKFGVLWALLAAVPMALLWIPVLKPLRNRWPVYSTAGGFQMAAFLSANLLTAAISAATTTVILVVSLRHMPGESSDIAAGDYFRAYLLGAYLGGLTLTPTVVGLYERFRALGGQPLTVRAVGRSALLRDLLGWVLPSLAVLTWMALATSSETLRQVARLAMLVPVLGMTWRHSWHGTAMAGFAASAATALTSQAFLDSQMVHAQVILAMALSGALLWSARTKTPGP